MVTEVERREWGEYEHGVDRRSAEAQGLPRVDVGSEIKDAVDKGIRRAFGKVRLLVSVRVSPWAVCSCRLRGGFSALHSRTHAITSQSGV